MKKPALVLVLCFFSFLAFAQKNSKNSFFSKADSLNQKRYYSALAISSTSYLTINALLYQTWYKNYDQEPFHFFNDFGEWKHMDKLGHLYSAYIQSSLAYQGVKWTGQSEKNSIIAGIVVGTVFQSTIEVMDGFSSKWGFSIPDVAFNLGGTATFTLQQIIWKEQRIQLKVSNIPRQYNPTLFFSTDMEAQSSLEKRATNLYGTSFPEKFLKDYNSMVIWASFNPKSFAKNSAFPAWLNISLGYGAENLFGGYSNIWYENGHEFSLDPHLYQRYSSFFISPDIDFNRIRTKSALLNTGLDILNGFKVPLPTLEINTLGEFHLHWIM